MRLVVLLGVALSLSGCESCRGGGGGGGGGETADASAPIDGAPTNTDPDATPVNATPIPTASVAKMLNPDKLPAYTGPTGSVEGTVTVKGLPPPETPGDFHRCPDAEKTWGKLFREGPDHALADAIVAVTDYKGFYIPEKEDTQQLVIAGCGFTQRTLTITYGQRVAVKNEAKEFWTPILKGETNKVLRMATPKGDPVYIYPKLPGHYILGDRDRAYAEVDLYAFLFPLHTVTTMEGKYRIDGLPVGKVKVSARHPHIDYEASVELDVKPAVVHKIDFVIEYQSHDAGRTYDAGTGYPVLR